MIKTKVTKDNKKTKDKGIKGQNRNNKGRKKKEIQIKR